MSRIGPADEPAPYLALDRSARDKRVGRAVRDILTAPGPLRAAVAYVTGDAAALLGIPRRRVRDLRLVCEPYLGNCDPASLNRLQEGGAEVYCVGALHAKVYISAAGVAVGSVNLSSGAMDGGTLEAVAVHPSVRNVTQATAWFEALVKTARPWQDIVGDPIYRDICARYEAKRGRGTGASGPRKTRTLIEALQEPVALGERLVINLVDPDDTPISRRVARAAATTAGRQLPTGWDYDAMDPGTRALERAANEVPARTAVLTVRVRTPDDAGLGVTEFVDVDPDLALWIGAQLVDDVLYGYYAPADGPDSPTRDLRLNLGARSRTALIRALNAGIETRPEIAGRLGTQRFATPADLAALLR